MLRWIAVNVLGIQENTRQKSYGAYGVKAIAHRGGRVSTPENTLLAFENGIDYCDMIELDVWLTKDKKVVVVHDQNLKRVTGKDAIVTDTNFDQLPRVLNLPSEGFQQGSSSTAFPRDGVAIPLLDDVLKNVIKNKKHCLVVEVKQDSVELAAEVKRILEEYDMLKREQVVWFSLNNKINKMLGKVEPAIPRIASVADVTKCTFAYWFGILPLMRFDFQIYGSVCGDIAPFIRKNILLKYAPEFVVNLISRFLESILATKQIFEYFQSIGKPCYLLGVNTDEEFELSRSVKANAVLTDRPEWLLDKRSGL